MEFTTIWPLLLDNGVSPKKEEGTRRFWLTLTPEQHKYLYGA